MGIQILRDKVAQGIKEISNLAELKALLHSNKINEI